MRVLSNIAGKAVMLVDETATRWLTRLGEGETARAGEIAQFRRLVFCGLGALLTVPPALSLLLP
ncbi:two-component sensor histidine kinase, partial [Neorhizobium sp. BETTINA12A]|nr:two-component sensor histidine kinase [Neorhizobium sp. BETTINA12A]